MIFCEGTQQFSKSKPYPNGDQRQIYVSFQTDKCMEIRRNRQRPRGIHEKQKMESGYGDKQKGANRMKDKNLEAIFVGN